MVREGKAAPHPRRRRGRLDWLGVQINPEHNEDESYELSAPGSRIRVFRIPTDEERMIARHVIGLMAAAAADLVPLNQVRWAA
jgi:acetate kinase